MSKEVTLEITLQNALATDETVQFSFEDGVVRNALRERLSEEEFKDDADGCGSRYALRCGVPATHHPRGETKGTTTMTVTRLQRQRNDSRAFTSDCDELAASHTKQES